MLSNLRLVLSVDVQPGDQHNVKHATGGLWSLLDRWDRGRWPRLLRGDLSWGIEPVMAQAEQRNLAYLFRLRTTKNVSRALQRAMAQSDWAEAGQGWQGKETRVGSNLPAAEPLPASRALGKIQTDRRQAALRCRVAQGGPRSARFSGHRWHAPPKVGFAV